jgi:hypothetical protein
MLFNKGEASKVSEEINKFYTQELKDLENPEIGVFSLAFKKVFRDFFIESDSSGDFSQKTADEPWWGALIGLHPQAFDKEKGIKGFFSVVYYAAPLITKLRLPVNLVKFFTIFPLAIADGALRVGGNQLEKAGILIVPQVLYGLHFLAKGLYLLARSTLSPRQSYLQSNKISKILGYLSIFSTVVTQAAVLLPVAPLAVLSVASLGGPSAAQAVMSFFQTIGSALTYAVSALSVGTITSAASVGSTTIKEKIFSFANSIREKTFSFVNKIKEKKPSANYDHAEVDEKIDNIGTSTFLAQKEKSNLRSVDLSESNNHSHLSIISTLVDPGNNLLDRGSISSAATVSQKSQSWKIFARSSSVVLSAPLDLNVDVSVTDPELLASVFPPEILESSRSTSVEFFNKSRSNSTTDVVLDTATQVLTL